VVDGPAPAYPVEGRTGAGRSTVVAGPRRRRLSADGRVGIVGASHHQQALADAVAAGGAVVAVLVPEPDDLYDEHAVRVDVVIGGATAVVGYLAHVHARRYQPVLMGLRRQGFVGTCPATVSGGGPRRPLGLLLHLADPQELVLENLADDIELLAPERTIAVAGVADHRDDLVRMRPDGRATRVAVTLRTSSSGPTVDVLLDGRPIGRLGAAPSARYRRVVAEPERRGGRAACEAVVARGPAGYRIDLRLPRVR
jgi:hypothetical protein